MLRSQKENYETLELFVILKFGTTELVGPDFGFVVVVVAVVVVSVFSNSVMRDDVLASLNLKNEKFSIA